VQRYNLSKEKYPQPPFFYSTNGNKWQTKLRLFQKQQKQRAERLIFHAIRNHFHQIQIFMQQLNHYLCKQK